jgi:hypothetical protein
MSEEITEQPQKTEVNKWVLISVALLLGVLIGIVGLDLYKGKPSNANEELLLKINAAKDSTIAARLLEKQTFLQYIDSLKGADTTIYNQETRTINRYYYENNRINTASADSQAMLLSKNLTKGLKREREGYYDVPR